MFEILFNSHFFYFSNKMKRPKIKRGKKYRVHKIITSSEKKRTFFRPVKRILTYHKICSRHTPTFSLCNIWLIFGSVYGFVLYVWVLKIHTNSPKVSSSVPLILQCTLIHLLLLLSLLMLLLFYLPFIYISTFLLPVCIVKFILFAKMLPFLFKRKEKLAYFF